VLEDTFESLAQGHLPLSSDQELLLRERLTEIILGAFVPDRPAPDRLKKCALAKIKSGNWLLSSLTKSDFDLLKPGLKPVELAFMQILEDYDEPFSHVYFLCNGLASVVARDSAGRQSEVGVIGREGMTGSSAIAGDNRSPNRCFMQIAGAGYRLHVDALRAAVHRSGVLQDRLGRYVQAFATQLSQTALANAKVKADARLARWLLMAHDRVSSDLIELTHQLLAVMLGIRRAGITRALHELEARRLIKASRRKVIILDRAGLETFASGCYGVAEREYDRLLDH